MAAVGEPACRCSGPGDCPRFGPTRAWEYRKCAGLGCTLVDAEAFRRHRRQRAEGRTVPLGLTRVAPKVSRRADLRPACVHQGAEVAGCKSCGGPGAVVYYCDSPDDEADRCVRGKSRDKTVRSCLDCPHYSPASSNEATTGTPEQSR